MHAVSPTFGDVMPLHSAAASRVNGRERPRCCSSPAPTPNARQQGAFAPLHAAAQNGDVEMVRDLLEHGADPRRVRRTTAAPRSSIAEEEGHDDVAALLRDVV